MGNPSTNTTFLKLAQTAQKISETLINSEKITVCSDYLSKLNNDADLHLAVLYLCEGAFATNSGKRISLGSRTIGLLTAEFCEIDYEKVYKPSKDAVGSASETIEKLLLNIPAARKKWSAKNITLSKVDKLFESLSVAQTRADKQRILQEAWTQMHPLEVKYFLCIAGRNSLKIGLKVNHVLSAIASAFGCSFQEVHHAYTLTGSAGEVAVLAKNNALQNAQLRLFQPVDFMLTTKVKLPAVKLFDDLFAEEIIDGFRAQLHISDRGVKLFSEDLADISQDFPEIVAFFEERNMPSVILDGTISMYKDEVIHPKQLLLKRSGPKKPSTSRQMKYPAIFISFDVLYFRDEPLYKLLYSQRRNILTEAGRQFHFPCSIQFNIRNKQDLEELFERSLSNGGIGLILKHKDSVYEFGQRSKNWLKLKKPGGSLKTVMMYAHSGKHQQGMSYSEFTFGISVKDDERYEEEFIPIGKCGGEFSDEEWKKLTDRIKKLTAEKYGPTLGLVPEIVVELEFDNIQLNMRTKANFVLQSPKIKGIRWDLLPGDVQTLSDVERLAGEKLEQSRQGQNEYPAIITNF